VPDFFLHLPFKILTYAGRISFLANDGCLPFIPIKVLLKKINFREEKPELHKNVLQPTLK